MTVGAHEPSVKSHVHAVLGRHGEELSRQESSFFDTVFFVEGDHYIQLYLVVSLGDLAVGFEIRGRSAQKIESLACERLIQRLLVLVLRKVRQKVSDAEDGITGLIAKSHVNGHTVGLPDYPVEGQRNGRPLVFSYPAVVVCLEICDAVRLVEGVRLQIKSGGVDMGSDDPDAVIDLSAADLYGDEGFSAQYIPDAHSVDDPAAQAVLQENVDHTIEWLDDEFPNRIIETRDVTIGDQTFQITMIDQGESAQGLNWAWGYMLIEQNGVVYLIYIDGCNIDDIMLKTGMITVVESDPRI